MLKKIKVLIPVGDVPEDLFVYRRNNSKLYTVKHLYTANGNRTHILLSTESKAVISIQEDSTEVILETDLETLNNMYGDK